MRIPEITADLGEFGIHLPVRASSDDTCTIVAADGRDLCVIDHNGERDTDEANEITGLLIQLINAAGAASRMDVDDDGFEWAIVEVFGHRRHAGRAREEERFGAKMLRIDVPTIVVAPAGDSPVEPSFDVSKWTTHWYGGSSIFSFTLTDVETVMRTNRPYYSPHRYIAPPETADIDDHDQEDLG